MKKEKIIAITTAILFSFGLLSYIPKINAEDKNEFDLSNPTIGTQYTTWDCIYFGEYLQEDTNNDDIVDEKDEKQPIKWRVLSIDGNDAFLISDKILDRHEYNECISDVFWENCSLRKWLNEDFLNNAFSENEQNAIIETTISNETTSPNYNETINKDDTNDKIYVPSIDEINNYNYGLFSTRDTKNAEDTLYNYSVYHKNIYWLRTCGKIRQSRNEFKNVYFCVSDGVVESYGISEVSIGVRPCIHLDLNADVWKKAESVEKRNSTEIVTQPPMNYTTKKTTVDFKQSTIASVTAPAPSTKQSKNKIDKTKPTIKGVKNKKTYKKSITIKFSDKSGIKKATLNGKKIKSGKKIKKNGKYTLIVIDKAGNVNKIKFVVKIKKK